MELKDLEKMTVVKLREEAHKFEDLKGVSGMNKQQLIDVLCEKLDIHRPHTEVEGIDKPTIKGRLKALQAKRKQALADRDYATLADLRMRIKRYKRMIKKHTHIAA
jgi:hypothetical protein